MIKGCSIRIALGCHAPTRVSRKKAFPRFGRVAKLATRFLPYCRRPRPLERQAAEIHKRMRSWRVSRADQERISGLFQGFLVERRRKRAVAAPNPASQGCVVQGLGLGTSGIGEWRSLVAHLVWDQRVASSNLVSPTTFFKSLISLTLAQVEGLPVQFAVPNPHPAGLTGWPVINISIAAARSTGGVASCRFPDRDPVIQGLALRAAVKCGARSSAGHLTAMAGWGEVASLPQDYADRLAVDRRISMLIMPDTSAHSTDCSVFGKSLLEKKFRRKIRQP